MKTMPRANKRTQGGQATIEYLYVIPILLILLLGSLQFIFIYEAKQTLNYAAFNGTRNGALNGGQMTAIQDGVVSGLAPLFVHAETQQALKDARRVAYNELSNVSLARIEILNPTSTILAGFGGTIPNDNLMYRSTDVVAGNVNVQDANLLKVRVTYCVRLIVPIVNRMIYAFTVAPPATPDKIDTLSGTSSGSGVNKTYTLDTKITAADMLKVSPPSGATGLCYLPTDPYPYRIPVTSESLVRMQTPFVGSGVWNTSP
jgi:hypothetical protein